KASTSGPTWIASPAGDVVVNGAGGITRAHGTTYNTNAVYQQTLGDGGTLDFTVTSPTGWGSVTLQPPAGSGGKTFAFLMRTGYVDLYTLASGQTNYVWAGEWPVTAANHIQVPAASGAVKVAIDGAVKTTITTGVVVPLTLNWTSTVEGQGLTSAS